MAKKNYYAWRAPDGRGGIFDNYPDCQCAFSGVSREMHRGFATYAEAWAFAFPGKPLPEAAVETVKAMPFQSRMHTVDSPAPSLDPGKAEKPLVGDEVRKYCQQYRFDRLSEDQMRAVQARDGRYLLFAVPGSGKTTVVMARTGYLIHSCDIPARQIMTLTFTRAAAEEMRCRYRRAFPEDPETGIPDFRTIHSFCYSILLPRLRLAGYVFPIHVLDNPDTEDEAERKRRSSHSILSGVLKKIGIQRFGDEACQTIVRTAISGIKNRMLAVEALHGKTMRVDTKDVSLAALVTVYEKALKDLDCLDYDDMLIHALHGLRAFPHVLRAVQTRYHYWSVDEAQDDSVLQHELVALLSGGSGNLFMVGDDDQSIYSFRGAEPSILLRYGARRDVHTLVMGTNYRSGRDIVDTARAFIEYNEHRADKLMSAGRVMRGEIRFPRSFANESEQYAHITAAAQAAQEQGKRLGVLYQFNASALPLMVRLRQAGIPYESSKSIREICRGKVIDCILRVLRFVLSPNSFERFEKCRNILELQTGEEHTKQIKDKHRRHPKTPVLDVLSDVLPKDDYRIKRAKEIKAKLETISCAAPAAAVDLILYGFRLADEVKSLNDRVCLYSILSVCDQFRTIRDMVAELDAIADEERRADADKPTDDLEESNGAVNTAGTTVVSLSTIHSAKGREWEHVILMDLFEQGIPGKPQPDQIGYDPEEMRRLFYVAITRAKRQLELLTVESIHWNYEQSSSFITDYAFECEAIIDGAADAALPMASPPENAAHSSQCMIRPATYYGVPVGRKPGVYTSWDDVKTQTDGFSRTTDQQPKAFATKQEALAYVISNGWIPDEAPTFSFDSIDTTILKNGSTCFNRPIDLPKEIAAAFQGWFHVSSLSELPEGEVDRLKRESDLFNDGGNVDYSHSIDGYVAAYMPVNFYKIWLPLWKLLNGGTLPTCAKILELGPGPGTSTCSVIELYRRLALENPDVLFRLDYTVIEREPAFEPVFRTFCSAIIVACPENLHIIGLDFIQGDAFSGMEALETRAFDLIIESNLLNVSEGSCEETGARFLQSVERLLTATGKAILIEPAQSRDVQFLNSLAGMVSVGSGAVILEAPHKAAVNVSDISMMRELKQLQLRSGKMVHWFSTMTLQRREVN